MQSSSFTRKADVTHILLFGAAVVIAAQIHISILTNNFVISIGIVLFSVFIFLFHEIPLLPITALSGVGVFLSRVLLNWLSTHTFAGSFQAYFPETIFYISYGLLFYLYARHCHFQLDRQKSLPPLFVIDYCANLTELLLRLGSQAFLPRIQASILLTALMRTLLIWAILSGLSHYKFILLNREHAERYQRLILLISKLNGEVIWMKKNTALIEETMNTSYRLYSDMKKQNLDDALCVTALGVAKDIHEIKKEYMMILRGLADALDLNLQDEGMYLSDLLSLLQMSTSSAAAESGKEIQFHIHCENTLFTDKHYFLLSIFRNLFTNALEAAVTDTVKISFSQTVSGDRYHFEVTDNGPGIDPDNMEQIFTPGFSTKINYETGEISRGLGLNLVKDLIRNQMHGTISVTSHPGSTTFFIDIPKAELEASTI